MTRPNPFAPTFGASPPLLAGRDKPIHNITTALESGPNHPDRTVIFTGMRGSGKTVLLNEVEDRGQLKGWIAISHDASTPGFVNRVARDTDRELEELEGPPPTKRLSGVEAGGFGVEFENVPPEPRTLDLRRSLTELADRLVQHGTGVLITIDELQNADRTEARALGSVIQHVARRQGKPVAFVGAALPSIENTILADQAITFFQRCSRYEIGPLDPTATRAALVVPINDQGGFITADALDAAVKESRGYPFMVQLIGFHMWELADGKEITHEIAVSAVDEANNRFATAIMGPTWRQLSKADRRFLIAMAQDDGPSILGDIAARLEVTTGYASVYRKRLIDAGMIQDVGPGRVDYTHSLTRDWVTEEGVKLTGNDPPNLSL